MARIKNLETLVDDMVTTNQDVIDESAKSTDDLNLRVRQANNMYHVNGIMYRLRALNNS